MDYGAAPSFRDWIDHIQPAALEGDAELENGASMTWHQNYLKRDNGNLASSFLFFRGFPTEHFYYFNERLSTEVANHLRRFRRLHWSDWFFNRAVSHVLIAAGQKGLKRRDGESFSRGSVYWAEAAIKALNIWREGSSDVHSMSRRGLIPGPLSEDRKVLASLQKISKSREVLTVVRTLVPFVQESEKAIRRMSDVHDQTEAKKLLSMIRSNRYVVPRVKHAIRHNLSLLDFADD